MRILPPAVLTLVLATGVGASQLNEETIPRLVSRGSLARGCPVGENTILTARHVVYGGATLIIPRWSVQGASGQAKLQQRLNSVDLALLSTKETLPVYYRISPTAPEVGAKVLVYGYNLGKKHLPPRVVRTQVTAVFAGHLYYRNSPGPGSSGSCILDAETRVVYGINTGRLGEHGAGVGVAVWGKWNPLL